MNENIVKQSEDFALELIRRNNPPERLYHDIEHTKDVIRISAILADAAGCSDEEKELVLIAAAFHDTGYVDIIEGHEEKSVEYARNFLAENDYPRAKIDKICNAILATKIPTEPKDLISEILCDADLHHVGTKEFFEKNELYRIELEKRNGELFPEEDWLKTTIDFFTNHKFYTKYAKEKYTDQKHVNLLKLQKRYKRIIKENEFEEIEKEKIAVEKKKLKKKKKENKNERVIETMFRNVMRTHVELNLMADRKANIMIIVNNLLLGAIATILLSKLDSNPHLIIPTIVLTIVSLTSLIFAVLVTRPSVNSGKFTKEDIHNKKANLLFFGNFFNMKLDEFTWGMTELMNDKQYLYESMIKDFHQLGQVLGRKYKYLRICYNIFMYGIIIAILTFAIFIALNPGQTELSSIL